MRAGDLLVRFEIPSLTAGAAASRAGIEQAQARVENAKAASARLTGLFERGVAARKEVEDAERELREAQAALAQAQSASGAADTLAARLVVRARFAGVVAKRWHNPGRPGRGGARRSDSARHRSGAPPGRRRRPGRRLARIAVGAPARVVDPAGGEPEDAKVITRPAAVEAGA